MGDRPSVGGRGFKTLIWEEAESFTRDQPSLCTTVEKITYCCGQGVIPVTLPGGGSTADYVIVSFSLGVLQNDDVIWEPELEAIYSMTMVSYFLLPHTIGLLHSNI